MNPDSLNNKPVLRRFLGLVVVGIALCASSALAAKHITTPLEQFGFNIGDDYQLANYQQLSDYWKKLETESNRIKVLPIGTTEEGRIMLMAVITSPANHRHIQKIRDTARRLALADGLDDKLAKSLAARGKAIVCISGGLHSTETVGAQQLIESVYQLVSSQDDETRRVLDDVVVLEILTNPDGMDLVSNYYMQESDPKKRSLAGIPRLFQKYIGHDNNRDYYALTQRETKNVSEVLYRNWFPEIVCDNHQPGANADQIIFIPPFRDPFNYQIHPLAINGTDQLGAAIMARFIEEGKPGATCRSGATFSTWYNGGLRTACFFHNVIGLVTECAGNPTPIYIPFIANKQLPHGDLPFPVPPQEWHFRQSIDYDLSATHAVLNYASVHRAELLYNIYDMGRDAIAKGSTDSWPISPSRIAQLPNPPKPPKPEPADPSSEEQIRAVANKRQQEDTLRIKTYAEAVDHILHAPELRNPRGYILPSDQADFLTATTFMNSLIGSGIKVLRATHEFQAAGKEYPVGSYVVPCAQAFRPHVLDMFEPQDHPNDLAYKGGPPVPPYDIAGWTPAFQCAVKFDRILDGFTGPFVTITNLIKPAPGHIIAKEGALGFFLSARVNDAYRVVNRILASGGEVLRLKEPFNAGTVTYPAGTFYIPNTPAILSALQEAANVIGVSFQGTTTSPDSAAIVLHSLRIGLWDRIGGSIPSGWARWIFERFEFPFKVVKLADLNSSEKLNKDFDVLIFPTGAIADPKYKTKAGEPDDKEIELAAVTDSKDDNNSQDNAANEADTRPVPGVVTNEKTFAKLRQFAEQGGTILTIGTSAHIAACIDLPLENKLVKKDEKGNIKPLSRDEFYIPGSILRARVDTTQPLAYGMETYADVMFDKDPVLGAKPNAAGVTKVLWYDSPSPLRSGWALGQKVLENGLAVAEVKLGKGRVVLYGPEVLFRGCAHGTFKLLFNGIITSGPNSPTGLIRTAAGHE